MENELQYNPIVEYYIAVKMKCMYQHGWIMEKMLMEKSKSQKTQIVRYYFHKAQKQEKLSFMTSYR